MTLIKEFYKWMRDNTTDENPQPMLDIAIQEFKELAKKDLEEFRELLGRNNVTNTHDIIRIRFLTDIEEVVRDGKDG